MGLPSYDAELFEPGEYINADQPGYFTVAGLPNGRWQQSHHETQHLPQVIEGLNPRIDTWISQAVFENRTRRAVHLASVGLLFADLDTYNIPDLARRKPEEQARLFVSYCLHNNIPAPSVILFSGRGLQAKWILSEALGRDRAPEWSRTEAALVNALRDFGADQAAKDLARVLRVDRTVNSKSGEYCRVVYVNSGVDSVPTRYDFDELSELFSTDEPEREPVTVPSRSSHSKIVHLGDAFNLRRLNWYRLEDIRELWRMRGGVPVGYREKTLFWELNFLLRAEPVRYRDIWKEAQSLAGEIDTSAEIAETGSFYRNSELSTLYAKAKATANGESIEYRGRKYPALYTPRNSTLATIFEITPEEERNLRTIISYSEKQRRRKEKRRAEGMREQPYRYEKPWEALGISRRAYYKRLKKAL